MKKRLNTDDIIREQIERSRLFIRIAFIVIFFNLLVWGCLLAFGEQDIDCRFSIEVATATTTTQTGTARPITTGCNCLAFLMHCFQAMANRNEKGAPWLWAPNLPGFSEFIEKRGNLGTAGIPNYIPSVLSRPLEIGQSLSRIIKYPAIRLPLLWGVYFPAIPADLPVMCLPFTLNTTFPIQSNSAVRNDRINQPIECPNRGHPIG